MKDPLSGKNVAVSFIRFKNVYTYSKYSTISGVVVEKVVGRGVAIF